MSRMGVPSSISTPRTCSVRPSRRRSTTTVSPMGFGRRGERVAKTPCERSSQGGEAVRSKSVERSNSHSTKRCEKPSMSARPRLELGQDLEPPLGLVLGAKAFGNLFGFLVGSFDKSDGTRGEHTQHYESSRVWVPHPWPILPRVGYRRRFISSIWRWQPPRFFSMTRPSSAMACACSGVIVLSMVQTTA